MVIFGGDVIAYKILEDGIRGRYHKLPCSERRTRLDRDRVYA